VERTDESGSQNANLDDTEDDSTRASESMEKTASGPSKIQLGHRDLSAHNFEIRATFLTRAKNAADRYSHLAAIDPSDVLIKMKKAHEQLEDCASEKKNKPEDISQALAEVNDYVSAVQAYSDAISNIRKATPIGE
jgi:hypothetical protein